MRSSPALANTKVTDGHTTAPAATRESLLIAAVPVSHSRKPDTGHENYLTCCRFREKIRFSMGSLEIADPLSKKTVRSEGSRPLFCLVGDLWLST